MTALVEAEALSRCYGRGRGAFAALDGVDLRIESGEFVAITGPSGSGKSTLMNLLGLLDSPTSGSLRLRGEDVARLSSDARARMRNQRIGFVFQAYQLLPRRTARANVELPLVHRGVVAAERRRLADAALARVGLAARADALPRALSGGEQQRVAIARATVGQPDLILADEPTGALDSRTGAAILSMLEDICAEGRTLIMVTHDHAIAARATRRIALADGRLAPASA